MIFRTINFGFYTQSLSALSQNEIKYFSSLSFFAVIAYWILKHLLGSSRDNRSNLRNKEVNKLNLLA